jgi:hypothetical protein
MRAQLIKGGIKTPYGVVERADQQLEENCGGGKSTVIEAADAFAELLADFIEGCGVSMPDRQNALWGGENMDLMALPAGSAIQVTARSRSRPIYILPACPKRSAQAMSELSSPSSRSSSVRARSSPAKMSSQKNLPARS